MNKNELDLFIDTYNNYSGNGQLFRTNIKLYGPDVFEPHKRISIWAKPIARICKESKEFSFDFNDPNLKRFNFNDLIKEKLLIQMTFRNLVDDIQIDFTPENIFSVAKNISNYKNIDIHELKRYLHSDEDKLKFDLLYGSI